jgi:hypothetical protein
LVRNPEHWRFSSAMWYHWDGSRRSTCPRRGLSGEAKRGDLRSGRWHGRETVPQGGLHG